MAALLDAHPELVELRGTNGNDLFGMANDIEITRLLLERGAEVNRGNDYGWTKLHQAGYGNDPALARLLLDAGARTDLYARGDGGTPLIAALFWGHREVAELLGLEPGNLRVAAGLGKDDMIDELVGTPAAGAHRGFYRPHGGFPAWMPSDDPQEILDEALVWAAKADRVEAIDRLVELGARVEADPYRGTPLSWAAANGRVAAIRRLVELGADVNQPTTFGGPDHGQDVFALHLAAQAGQEEAVDVLLELGADPTLRDGLYRRRRCRVGGARLPTGSRGAVRLRPASRIEAVKVGVLAVQGNFREHAAMLRRLGADVVDGTRLPERSLDGLDGTCVRGRSSCVELEPRSRLELVREETDVRA